MTAILLSALVAGDVACAESSRDWADVEAVLAVAANRHGASGRALLRVLTRPHQFARGCVASGKPRRYRLRHAWAGLRAHVGALDVPEWMDGGVLFFCAERGPTSGCARWRQPGSWARGRIEPAGRVGGHTYWTDRQFRG